VHKTKPIQIIEVIDKMTQGMSEPILCKCENNEEYIVKGLGAGRSSQISEWVCANLAQSLGLPVADFALVEVSEVLYDELPSRLRSIGSGIAFGSKKVQGPSWFEGVGTGHVSEELQSKILIFDLWIKNMDRTSGNPNLLYQAESESLVIIDHNLAFDKDFNSSDFLATHVFADCFADIANDLVARAEMEVWLQKALATLDEVCNNLPREWEWSNVECDLPVNYDYGFMRQVLERCEQKGKLWEGV